MGEQDDSSNNAGRKDMTDSPAHQEPSHDELERQAREAIDSVRASAGELGARVRDVVQRASATWQATAPVGDTAAPDPSSVSPADEQRARKLARRWVDADFLVEPELARYMGVRALSEGALWRIELSERGESRSLAEATEPYRGTNPAGPGPIQPMWDYAFPVPEIAAGERRERLANSGMLGACTVCSGSGHRHCAACEGNGFVTCSACHGRGRISCRRCRGRGRVADPVAERRARANHTYWQVQAQRLANDAASRLADFSEKLRQEHGVPLPPAAHWVPLAPASGETIPCPDCVNGTVTCAACQEGKQVCPECQGSAYALCSTCAGSGRAIRYREIVRRFDTRASERHLPASDEVAAWLDGEWPRRVAGDVLWEGSAFALPTDAPDDTPANVWAEARALAGQADEALRPIREPEAADDRHILERQVRILRIPVTHVEYTFDTHPFAFTVVGTPSAERFIAHDFPPRWHRIGRFLRALTRDLTNDLPARLGAAPGEDGGVSSLAEYRLRRMHTPAQHVRILADNPATPSPEPAPTADTTPSE